MITLGPLVVQLSAIEAEYDMFVAKRRMEDVQKHHRRNAAALAEGDDEMGNHLVGAHGEHAFAKRLGIARQPHRRFGICSICNCYVGTVNTFKRGGDVDAYQVRTRRYARANLIVREKDRDTDIFVLVVPDLRDGKDFHMQVRSWRMVGWILGADAKQFRWRNDPRARGAAYFVPQEALQLMALLPTENA